MKITFLRIAALATAVISLAPAAAISDHIAVYSCALNRAPDPSSSYKCPCDTFPSGIRFQHKGMDTIIFDRSDWCPVEGFEPGDVFGSSNYAYRPLAYSGYGDGSWDESIDAFSQYRTPYANNDGYSMQFNGQRAVDADSYSDSMTSRFSPNWQWHRGGNLENGGGSGVTWDTREELVNLAFSRLDGYRSISSPSAEQVRVYEYYTAPDWGDLSTASNLSSAEKAAPSPDPEKTMEQYLFPLGVYIRAMRYDMLSIDWDDEMCTYDAAGDQVCPTLTQRINDDYAIWRSTKNVTGIGELRSMTYDALRGQGAQMTSGRITPQWGGMTRNLGEHSD
ncbi:hypothetical protein [Tranquillimonas alkanivorans]|uniref:Uncharacterized protein n=1 Tax=Tranquillimonas alkanivorans TaxID=441119 RepID=A0A1I5V2E3_9RHOB|nr:hypothetical protein [Tranquillimonas alkanivorans]SFQ01650.1 hypothetical protein SAMN04488047_12630 [Tranquillimonas alkanivorans]